VTKIIGLVSESKLQQLQQLKVRQKIEKGEKNLLGPGCALHVLGCIIFHGLDYDL